MQSQKVKFIEELSSDSLEKKVNIFMSTVKVISAQYSTYKENGGERTILSCMVHYEEKKSCVVHYKERKSGLPMSAYDGEFE